MSYQNTFNHSSHTISNQAHSTSLLQSQGDPHYGLTSHYHTPQSAASIISDDSVYSFKRRMDISSQLHAAMHGNMHMNHNHEEIPPIKKTRTNTPWTPDEEKRLKELRDVGTTWSEIAKSFPNRTEGSVKKHWYKDMHYAEFSEDEKNLLFDAIREYDANKWKSIGNRVGKPAKACEQFAREHFNGR